MRSVGDNHPDVELLISQTVYFRVKTTVNISITYPMMHFERRTKFL